MIKDLLRGGSLTSGSDRPTTRPKRSLPDGLGNLKQHDITDVTCAIFHP